MKVSSLHYYLMKYFFFKNAVGLKLYHYLVGWAREDSDILLLRANKQNVRSCVWKKRSFKPFQNVGLFKYWKNLNGLYIRETNHTKRKLVKKLNNLSAFIFIFYLYEQNGRQSKIIIYFQWTKLLRKSVLKIYIRGCKTILTVKKSVKNLKKIDLMSPDP